MGEQLEFSDIGKPSLVEEPARVLCADPPWSFNDALPGKARGAVKHYRCLSLGELMQFPVPHVAKDAVLYLWRVSSMLEEALQVVRAWGFTPKSEMIWEKYNPCQTCGGSGRLEHVGVECPHCFGNGCGKRWFGMGRYGRNDYEGVLIATRGSCTPKSASISSSFAAPVFEHSAKPERFYDIVERMYDGPYTELFARRQRAGWRCLGDEAETGGKRKRR